MIDIDTLSALEPADGLVVALAILVGEVLKAFLPEAAMKALKPVLPTLIVLVAVGARAAYDIFMVEGLTVETVLRGFVAAAVAVLAHAQFRSVYKALGSQPEPEVLDDNHDEPDAGI